MRNQSSGQMNAVESAVDSRNDKSVQPPCLCRPAGQQNAAYNEQKRVEFSEAKLNTKPVPDQWNKNLAKNSESSCRDGRENAAENNGPEQGEKPRGKGSVHEPAAASRWTCRLCQARCNCALDYHNHLTGRRHRKNTEALRAGPGKTAADLKSAYYCALCDVQCSGEKPMASHLDGRRHREMLEGPE